jgi:hypothetical protein
VAGRTARAPGRVALVVAHPERHNRRALRMAGTLAGAGHRVTLYTAPEAGPAFAAPAGVERVVCLPEAAADGRDLPAGALDGVDVQGADVVQVAGQAALRQVATRLPEGCRLFYDVPGLEAPPDRAPGGPRAGAKAWARDLWLSVGEWFRAPRIDAVLCPGYVFGQYLQRELKLGKVPVVPIYAAHPLWETVRPEPPDCLRPGRPAVAVAGVDFADMAPAVRALAHVRAVDLVAVNGTGDWEPLRAEAEAMRMAERLHRVEVPEDGLIPALAAFQAGLVLPGDTTQRARYDLPDALFSFLMAGVPVVASDLPGLERVVSTHNVGSLADPDDTEAVADAVGRVCGDEALRERLLHNVAVTRRRRYCWEAQAGRLLDLYDQVLTSRA